jgi:hypothetical protein
MSFLKEVTKCDVPHATVARYKMGDVTTALHVHGGSNDSGYTVNINLTRGIHEAGVCIAAAMANAVCSTPGARITVDRSRWDMSAKIVNSSITADSVIACVRNADFKEKALHSQHFPLSRKVRFKTHKKIVTYTRTAFTRPEKGGLPDVMSSLTCTCRRCAGSPYARRKTPGTYHRRRKGYLTANPATGALPEFVEACLLPLQEKHEVQVHDRCFNCSSVSGPLLLPAVASMACDMLAAEETVRLDMALIRLTGFVESKINSLVPAHISDLCEIMCWQLGTRFMTRINQLKTAAYILEPIFDRLVCSRQNFAQADGWCQVLLRGPRLLLGADRANVSHKYANPETRRLFASAIQTRSANRVSPKATYSIAKRCRRRRGPVQLSSDLLRFKCGMGAYWMATPDKSDQ